MHFVGLMKENKYKHRFQHLFLETEIFGQCDCYSVHVVEDAFFHIFINVHIGLIFLPPLDTIRLSVSSRNLRDFLYSVSEVHTKNVLPD